MKVTEHIENAAGKTLFSFEILPPLKGQGIQSIFNGIDPLMEFKPPFIDVTYHREEFILKERENGTFDRIVTKKRPGTVAICAAIMNRYNIDAIPHLICGGFSKEETENALIDLNFLGIDNALLIRGDNVKGEKSFVPESDGNQNTLDLIEQVMGLNNGNYLDRELTNAVNTDFCIGVGGYPEKHYEAPNMKKDLSYLKKKVEMGADYIVTQMFFDNSRFFSFVESCRSEGITVPIIPGLKPLASLKQLNMLPSVFNIDIPEGLADEVDKCKDNKAAKQVGTEWAIQQCKELKEYGVPLIHFYTMSRSAQTMAIASQVF